jgi:hypothetical protein
MHKPNSYSKLTVYGVVVLFAVLGFFQNKMFDKKTNIIVFDGYGYYLYLPALYIYEDTKQFAFAKEHLQKYKYSQNHYQTIATKDGMQSPLYNIGLSFLWTPFFATSHFFCKHFTDYPADGMSYPYQWGIFFAALFYMALGFVFIRKYLMIFFEDKIVVMALLVMAFGTNFYYYALHGKEMTHIYLFAGYAMVLYYLQLNVASQSMRHKFIIGFLCGAMVLIRSSELVVCVLVGLYGFKSWKQFPAQLWLGVQVLACIIFVFFIQLLFYKINQDKWFVDGYQGFHFNWTKPQIKYCVFGVVKGWWVYSPLIVLAFIGLFLKQSIKAIWYLPILIFVLVNCYLLFCWSDYTYGTTFGCRPVVQSYALLIVPMASLFRYFSTRSFFSKIGIGFILVGLIYLNIFQTAKFLGHGIPKTINSWSFYWRTFFDYRLNKKDYVILNIDEKFSYKRYQLKPFFKADSVYFSSSNLMPQHQVYNNVVSKSITAQNIDSISNQWMHYQMAVQYFNDFCTNDNMPSFVVDCTRADKHIKYNCVGIPVVMDNRANDTLRFYIKNPQMQIGDLWQTYFMNNTPDSLRISYLKIDRVEVNDDK